MTDAQAKQVKMHKDFFDRCHDAINNRFYLEAIFLEYAAIEGRLESILGILGAPCNKSLAPGVRKNINISHRINCFEKLITSSCFEKTKMNGKFFKDIRKWIEKRNKYIHGLYKNEHDYNGRIGGARDIAVTGLDFCRLLYNEAKRLNRLIKKEPDILEGIAACAKLCFSSN